MLLGALEQICGSFLAAHIAAQHRAHVDDTSKQCSAREL